MFSDLFSSIFSRSSKRGLRSTRRPVRRRQHRRRIGQIEGLESRTLLSGDPLILNTDFDIDIPEDTAVGAQVGLIFAVADPGQTLSYMMDPAFPQTEFSVDSYGGVHLEESLDYETTSVYTVFIGVLAGSGYSPVTFNFTVTDVIEPTAPVFSPDTYNASVDEDADVGVFLTDLLATDPNADQLSYYIVSGDDLGQFYVDATGGLSVNSPLDYETNDSYTLVVEVTDGMEVDTATITINVNDVNEAPVILTFEVIDGWGDFWTFEGQIQDEDPGDLLIVFGGVLTGHFSTSFEDGSFMYTIEMSSTDVHGPVSVKAIDSTGRISQTEWRWVQG